MSTLKRVFVVGKAKEYADWIDGAVAEFNMKEADLVMFTGGEDVHPSLYNEAVGKHTRFNYNRDVYEEMAYNEALLYKKPMIGICRGAQFLCAMSGGRLVQHQENPKPMHPIITEDGRELIISSSHHQAMFPYELSDKAYRLIGWTENISKFHLDGMNMEITTEPFKEAEIVYFPENRALGIQGHPEWLNTFNKAEEETLVYLNNMVRKLLNKTL